MAQVPENNISKVIQLYGIKPAKILNPQSGYRNKSYKFTFNDKQANLIIYKNETGIESKIKQANRVSDYLAENGYPARRSLDPRIASISTANGRIYASIYNYLPGKVIPWESYTSRHLKIMGTSMAKMHIIMADMPRDNLPFVENVLKQNLVRMRQYFLEREVRAAMESKLSITLRPMTQNYYDTILNYSRHLNDKQVLHMDFVRGNILFSGKSEKLKISGVIDFEKTAYGHKVFDIARTLAFLFVDGKYKNRDEIFNKFLISGYLRKGGGEIKKIAVNLPSAKADLLESLIEFFWLYDLYKFMRHNPYESLVKNEHFVRTRDLLLSHKVVYSTSSKQPE